MYLLIFEDGEMKASKELSEDDKMSADDGLIDAVYVGDIEPSMYLNGEFHLIEIIGEGGGAAGEGTGV